MALNSDTLLEDSPSILNKLFYWTDTSMESIWLCCLNRSRRAETTSLPSSHYSNTTTKEYPYCYLGNFVGIRLQLVAYCRRNRSVLSLNQNQNQEILLIIINICYYPYLSKLMMQDWLSQSADLFLLR